MPTIYIYIKNDDYAKLVHISMDRKTKVSAILKKWFEERLEKEVS